MTHLLEDSVNGFLLYFVSISTGDMSYEQVVHLSWYGGH